MIKLEPHIFPIQYYAYFCRTNKKHHGHKEIDNRRNWVIK